MAVEVISFAVMRNHLHLLLGIRPDVVATWTDREVAERSTALQPNKQWRRQRGIPADLPPTDEEIDAILTCPRALQESRRRLSNLGVFHKLLKEPCARIWNKVDRVTGHFWEGRYQSKRVLDVGGLVHVARYVELNEVHAGAADSLESSVWTSAAFQWRNLRRAIEASVSSATEDAMPCDIAQRLLEVRWESVFPCGRRLQVGITTNDAMAMRDARQTNADAGDALGARDLTPRLVRHLESMHEIGIEGRVDKRGKISPATAGPLLASMRSVLKSRAGRPLSLQDPEAPRDATKRMLPPPDAKEELVASILGVLLLQRERDGAGDQDPPPYLSTGLRRAPFHGSCYGSYAAVREEATRRGRRWLWAACMPEPPSSAA